MAIKDVVKEILEADKLTKDNMKSTEELKIQSSNRMDEFLKKRESDYRYKVMMNKKIIEKIENSKAEIEISNIRREGWQILDRIDLVCEKHKEKWGETMFINVIESQL